MPKYKYTGQWPPFAHWLFLALLLLPLIWFAWEEPIVLVFIGVIALWTIIDVKRQSKKLQRLLDERKELSICEFARSFNGKEIDTWVIRAVYEQIQEYVVTDGGPLPIKADDNLVETLELDDDDLDLDLLEEILQRTGRSIENTENNPYFNKVKTVRDLVYFINEQPIVTNFNH